LILNTLFASAAIVNNIKNITTELSYLRYLTRYDTQFPGCRWWCSVVDVDVDVFEVDDAATGEIETSFISLCPTFTRSGH